jgi:hypothetical protein
VTCGHWIGAEGRYCGKPDARRYINTTACPDHTPARLAGRPEPTPGPGYTPQRIPSPLGDSRVVDARAVASGKRQANPHTYRAAQAATQASKKGTRP